MWSGPPPDTLPVTITGHPSYYQYHGRLVSLVCHGRVVIRMVLKLLSDPQTDPSCPTPDHAYAQARLVTPGPGTSGTSPSPVIRCELNGADPLSSQETNCKVCTGCSNGGVCPTAKGRWYSDSYTVTLPGCAFTGSDYSPYIASFVVNPGAQLVLAKFEVCATTPCFDAAYEAAKAAQTGG